MIYQLLDAIDGTGEDLAGLQTIVYGASPITPARLRQALSTVRAGFIQLYGQTECPNWGTTLSKTDHRRALDEPELLSSCGASGTLCEVSVLVDGRSAQPGEVGEVHLRSPYLMRGYLDNPEATAEALVDGWLRTGDLGLLDEQGYLHLKDRAKDMIISGGMNVYSSEVESVLQRFDGISQVAVIGVPHETWGEAVTAFVVVKPGDQVDLSALKAYARQELATYKRPKSIELVDALPLTAVGKPDKKALRAPYWTSADRQIT
jgi:fatty-acyl-CoA synthase/long-chain acyl-CoA synthetase